MMNKKKSKYNCLCCGKEIKHLGKEKYPKGTKDQCKLWDEGTVFTITTVYGSLHDGGIFRAGICDECLDTKTIIGTIKFVRDYFYGDTKYHSLKEARQSLNESGKMDSI